MPNIKPISDLRNYNEVLRDVEEGSPVFLTKNGRGKYAIVELRDYEKAQATIRLMSEIAKGRRSGEEKGCLTSEEMRAHFRARANEKTEITPFEPQAHKKGINLIGSIKSDTGLGQSMRLVAEIHPLFTKSL